MSVFVFQQHWDCGGAAKEMKSNSSMDGPQRNLYCGDSWKMEQTSWARPNGSHRATHTSMG